MRKVKHDTTAFNSRYYKSSDNPEKIRSLDEIEIHKSKHARVEERIAWAASKYKLNGEPCYVQFSHMKLQKFVSYTIFNMSNEEIGSYSMYYAVWVSAKSGHDFKINVSGIKLKGEY
jgi:hypothetical protein